MDWKLEVVVVPVSDVDRAKAFYADKAGFVVDVDQSFGDEFRVVQLTPRGSGCSVTIGKGLSGAAQGSVEGLQLVVADIDAAREELVGRGMEVTPVRHMDNGSGSTVTAARGTRSSSSAIPTATAGPSRRSPRPTDWRRQRLRNVPGRYVSRCRRATS